MNESEIRHAIVEQARWGVANAGQIHYSEIRPIPYQAYKAHHLPITTDCSGFASCCYFAAGFPHDPNGNDWNGQGFTGTLLANSHHINASELQIGDLIDFSNAHVVVVVNVGASIDIVSHGSEADPVETTLDDEIAGRRAGGFPIKPITYETFFTPALVPKRKRFVVYKDGQVVDHTNRWKTWVNTHRPFRNGVTDVRFHDRNANK